MQIPKPGDSNWKQIEGGSKGATSTAYGVVLADTAKSPFGWRGNEPYESRAEFYRGFLESMHVHGGEEPPLICGLCHGETPAGVARCLLRHADAMFNCVCDCDERIHLSLNMCPNCEQRS